ncbi:MAG: glycosyltransferase family 4 protein [Candidatus Cloacimonetes bacterium]|nr:glycosyltransferase family 4 protein [Candidatus Cloacimonadota bacterium]
MTESTENRRKVFVTIYLDFENVHVMKEPGQISYRFSKLFSFDSEVVTYRNGEYENLRYTPNLCLSFIEKKFNFKFIDLNCIKYIIKNATRIDVLHMQHFKLDTLAAGFFYKLLNPKGYFYVRLDFCPGDFFGPAPDKRFWFKEDGRFRTKVKNFLQKKFANYVDLWSDQDLDSSSFITKKYTFFKNKLIEVHNGVDIDSIKKYNFQIKNFEEKENIVLCSTARIGCYQKATDVLLETFALLPEDINWKLHIAGSIQPDFNKFINEFFNKNPGLKTKVFIHGELSKRNLYELYNKAKIFCLFSRFESFTNVLPEAMYFKNTLIVTNFGGAKIMVDDNKTGCIVERDNPKQMVKVLIKYISDDILLEKTGSHAHDFAVNNLGWDKIAVDLLGEMETHGYQR